MLRTKFFLEKSFGTPELIYVFTKTKIALVYSRCQSRGEHCL